MAMTRAEKTTTINFLLQYQHELRKGTVTLRQLVPILSLHHHIKHSPQNLRYWCRKLGITTKRAEPKYDVRIKPLVDACLYLLSIAPQNPTIQLLSQQVACLREE